METSVTQPDPRPPSASSSDSTSSSSPQAKKRLPETSSPKVHNIPSVTSTFSNNAFLIGGGMAGKALKSPSVVSPAPVGGLRVPGAFGPIGSETAAMPNGLMMTNWPSRISAANNNHHYSGKSIPIHCVVENGAKANAAAAALATDAPLSKPPSASLLPRLTSAGSAPAMVSNNDLITYALVPGSTRIGDLVTTALTKIGFTSTQAVGAKGSLQVKDWKPLTFDLISENPDATADEILGDIAGMVTLRIRLRSNAKTMASEDIKEQLFRLLLDNSRGVLSALGCPVDQKLLSQICAESPENIPEDVRDDLNQWLRAQSERMKPAEMNTPPSSMMSRNSSMGRLRTSFNARHEIPLLQKWFAINSHPSREQMNIFTKELNTLEVRQGRPLDLANVVFWFKNARAAQRRANANSPTDHALNLGTANLSTCSSISSDDTSDKELDLGLPRKTPSPTRKEEVPELPNRNAVYVVQPLAPHEEEDYAIVHMNEEGKSQSDKAPHHSLHEGDVNHNKCLSLQQDHQEEATDLSMRGRRSSGDNCNNKQKLSTSSSGYTSDGGRAKGLKREREDDDMYDEEHYETERYPSSRSSSTSSPSPKNMLRHDSKMHGPQMPHLPPLHAAQQFNPLALQMSAMSHAMSMGYLHPQLYEMNAAQLATMAAANGGINEPGSPGSMLEVDRKKRSRVFIDPLTEIPRLEHWFKEDTHPSSYMIEKFTEELNTAAYRSRFPRLEPKNVQLWFKNHRAKVKRQRLENPEKK